MNQAMHARFQAPFPSLFPVKKFYIKPTSWLGLDWDQLLLKRRKCKFHSLGAVERDSEFEVDPVKAQEALRKLDEQLQSLAEKPITRPKIRASDLNRVRGQMREDSEETVEISGSFLASVAAGLLVFTIFYNILFLTVIKPAIDGPEPIETSNSSVEAESTASLQQLPSIPGASAEP